MTSEFEHRAGALLGKRAIVGITYLDASGAVEHQIQMHGVISRAVENEGIFLRAPDKDEEFQLPPEPEAFQAAPRGLYTLRATGESVRDPDLMATWTVHRPEQ